MSGSVLVTSRSFGDGRLDLASRVAEQGYRVVRASPAHDADELAPLLHDAVGWIAGTGPVTADHLAAAPSLRVVARYGVGVDAVDLDAAAARGVVVTNTPGANSSAVVEHTLALLLTALRGIPAADRRVRQGDWGGWRTRELSALSVGVVGLGRIGRGVIDRVRAFGSDLAGADPFVPDDDPLWEGLRRTTATALATEADVVSLHAPGGAVIVDDTWLAASDRPVLIVNTARADLVDETALAAALRSGRVIAYAADTLATENHGSGASPLLAPDLADVVTITPHLGAQTVEGVDGMGGMAVQNLLAVLAGDTPPNPVSATNPAAPQNPAAPPTPAA